jgi:hypothetical protein
MICWSCQKEIPTTAEFCPHCEAVVEEEPTADETEVVQSLLATMSPEMIDELEDVFAKSATGEEFVNRIMIGDCPACGSSNTDDCESDPDVEDICLGRCLECGQLWCPDCGELLKVEQAKAHDCPAWNDFDLDDDEGQDAD